MRAAWLGVLTVLTAAAALPAAEPAPEAGIEQVDVFVSGADGVNTYRIPSLIITSKGTLLAFCEARKVSISDASPTDMVLKHSSDGGRTWSAMQVLIRGRGKEAITNPCPVLDATSNTVHLVCISAHKVEHGRHRHLMITSRDDGKTWSEAIDLGKHITPYDDTFVPGPGVGIQLGGGRLVIPGYVGKYEPKTRTGLYSSVIYSDDHAQTWRAGKKVSDFSNESQVVELVDGSLMLNMRSNRGQSCRAVAISSDGGQSWSAVVDQQALNECPCQASFIRYSDARRQDRNRLLFSNPDVAGARYGVVKRTRMTVRLSYDEAKTWPVSRLIHAGPSSYSCLVVLPDHSIGLIYEGGQKHRREWIRFARFSLQWLTDGKDQAN